MVCRRDTEVEGVHSKATEGESSAKQPRVDDPTPPDSGGAQSPPPVGTPSTPCDMAAANCLVKAGVSFIALEARSYSGGRAYTFKLGHEFCGEVCLRSRLELDEGYWCCGGRCESLDGS